MKPDITSSAFLATGTSHAFHCFCQTNTAGNAVCCGCDLQRLFVSLLTQEERDTREIRQLTLRVRELEARVNHYEQEHCLPDRCCLTAFAVPEGTLTP